MDRACIEPASSNFGSNFGKQHRLNPRLPTAAGAPSAMSDHQPPWHTPSDHQPRKRPHEEARLTPRPPQTPPPGLAPAPSALGARSTPRPLPRPTNYVGEQPVAAPQALARRLEQFLEDQAEQEALEEAERPKRARIVRQMRELKGYLTILLSLLEVCEEEIDGFAAWNE